MGFVILHGNDKGKNVSFSASCKSWPGGSCSWDWYQSISAVETSASLMRLGAIVSAKLQTASLPGGEWDSFANLHNNSRLLCVDYLCRNTFYIIDMNFLLKTAFLADKSHQCSSPTQFHPILVWEVNSVMQPVMIDIPSKKHIVR